MEKLESWEEHWGNPYSRAFKEQLLKPVFTRLENEGIIGKVVIDIGSGAHPISDFLSGEHQLITIDIAGERNAPENQYHVQADVEELADNTAQSTREIIGKICQFLGPNPRQKSDRVNTVILSEVLNYVDYKKVLEAAKGYLSSGGAFLIINSPERGYKQLFSEKGITNKEDLIEFLESLQFTVEEIELPFELTRNNSNTDSLFFIVATKK